MAIVTPAGMDMFIPLDAVVVVDADDVVDCGAGAGEGAPPPDEQAAIAAATNNAAGRAKDV